MEKVAIIGGGLVGAMEACFLAQRGYDVEVFERRGDIRKVELIGGRSINLALSDRGWRSLRKIGLEDAIRKIAIPMKGRQIHMKDGVSRFQPYGQEGQFIWSVSRGALNQKLLAEADKYPNCSLHFNHKCVHISLNSKQVLFENEGKKISREFERVVGTDGAFSQVRQRLQKTDRFNFSQHYLEHGYKELNIPPAPDGSHQLEKNALHIWPRGGYMLIALPNMDGSFTVTLFLAYEGNPSFEKLNTKIGVENFFKEEFPEAFERIPDLTTAFFENPTPSLITIRANPWHYDDRIVLLGDAAHAIVPFYGQGMNSGFEDCYEFDRLLSEANDNWSMAVPKYSEVRVKNGNAIADLALRNFVEMRDLTADKMFLLRKKIETRFAKKYPDKWIPLYSMVTFSHIPYAEAVEAAKIQDEIMEHIMKLPHIEQHWDQPEIERIILAYLDKLEQ
jgi:kynurenine 3-monooxygenase